MTELESSIELIKEDVKTIRQVMEGVKQSSHLKTQTALLSINVLVLLSAGSFLIVELFSRGQMTIFLMNIKSDPELVTFASVYIVGMLLLILFGCYFLILSVSKRQRLTSGAAFKIFQALNVGSILADLVLMTCFLVAVISFGQSVLISPLLLMFTGNFLFQGHLFRFPAKGASVAGLGCYILALIQFLLGSPSLMLPLTIFVTLSICSLTFIIKKQRGPRESQKTA